MYRDNLTIIGDALVDRVCFDGRQAVGVRVWIDGGWHEVQARETVLSAGAIHSPAILMRSGVGPTEALGRLGIPVVLHAPQVGQQLVDHPLVALILHRRSEAQVSDPHARHTNCCLRYSSQLAGAGSNDMMVLAANHQGTDEIGRTRGPFAFRHSGLSRKAISASPAQMRTHNPRSI